MSADLVVPARFCGPARSGNGGWTSGALAELLGSGPRDRADHWPPVEVTLLSPPPLDTPLPVLLEPDGASCEVARARTVADAISPVPAVGWEDAEAAEATYPGLRRHPFPSCFACGPARAEGDGLRIFPGQVADSPGGRRRVAARWTPHPSVVEDFHTYGGPAARASVPVTWASLDCIGGWSADLENRPMVLGRMTAIVESLPQVGRPHVVVGEWRGEDGRKTFTASTLYDGEGTALARAEHVWIAVDPTAFESATA
jgi:hypothetical protein